MISVGLQSLPFIRTQRVLVQVFEIISRSGEYIYPAQLPKAKTIVKDEKKQTVLTQVILVICHLRTPIFACRGWIRTGLNDGRGNRLLLKRLHLQSKRVSGETVQQAYYIASRLFLYSSIGRTAWLYMTQDRHETEVAKVPILSTRTGPAEGTIAFIERLAESLKTQDFVERFRMPEDVGNYAYDKDLAYRALIDRTLNKLWTLLLSGITFKDGPEEGSDAMKILRAITDITKASVEITTKVEVLTIAKILWPRWSFLTSTYSLQGFMEELNNQLMADGLLVPVETGSSHQLGLRTTASWHHIQQLLYRKRRLRKAALLKPRNFFEDLRRKLFSLVEFRFKFPSSKRTSPSATYSQTSTYTNPVSPVCKTPRAS